MGGGEEGELGLSRGVAVQVGAGKDDVEGRTCFERVLITMRENGIWILFRYETCNC